jgi:tRNA (cytidine/uridine-2'-O-)-methyltransferase
MVMHVVLYEPEIPANAGNISRTCAVAGASLHLIRPLGFSTDDKDLKRAGLDYWEWLDLHYYDNYEHFSLENAGGRFLFVTANFGKYYHEVSYQKSDFLIFGKEAQGLPAELLAQNAESCLQIPIVKGRSSLNSANSAGIILYEALRQLGFPNLQ